MIFDQGSEKFVIAKVDFHFLSQSNYLRHLDNRTNNVDTFLIKSGIPTLSETAMNVSERDEELSIDQIQQIMQNEHMTKEREKEVRTFIL